MSTETLLEKMNLRQRLETLEGDAQQTASDLRGQRNQLDGTPQQGFADACAFALQALARCISR